MLAKVSQYWQVHVASNSHTCHYLMQIGLSRIKMSSFLNKFRTNFQIMVIQITVNIQLVENPSHMRHNNSCLRIDCHNISQLISMVIQFTYFIPCSQLKALDSHKLCMVCQLQHLCNTRVYKDNPWSILFINSNCVLDPMEDITLTIMVNIIQQVVKTFCLMLSQYSSLAISHSGMTVLDPHSK